MDTKPLVIEQKDAGAELVKKRLRQHFQVDAAFWLNPSEDGDWALYVASPEIDNHNFDLAYGEAIRIVREMRTPYIDPFQVRIVGVKDPLAQAAIAINRRYPGDAATHYRGRTFGGCRRRRVHLPQRARHVAGLMAARGRSGREESRGRLRDMAGSS